jgi:hypothetical protein
MAPFASFAQQRGPVLKNKGLEKEILKDRQQEHSAAH